MTSTPRKRVIDTTHEGRGVWLVKVPRFVGDAMKKNRPGGRLGSVELTAGDDGRQQASLVLDSEVLDSENPAKYALNFVEDVGHMSILSETELGDFAVEGKVVEKCDARPEISAAYMDIMRKRSIQSHEKRFVSMSMGMAEVKQRRNQALQPSMGAKPAKPRGYQFERRAPMEEPLLRPALFSLFSKQANWTYKDIQKELDQPDSHMRKMLGKYAVQTRDGSNKFTWSLKPDYLGE